MKALTQHGIRLEVVKLPEAKRGVVLLPGGGSLSQRARFVLCLLQPVRRGHVSLGTVMRNAW